MDSITTGYRTWNLYFFSDLFSWSVKLSFSSKGYVNIKRYVFIYIMCFIHNWFTKYINTSKNIKYFLYMINKTSQTLWNELNYSQFIWYVTISFHSNNSYSNTKMSTITIVMYSYGNNMFIISIATNEIMHNLNKDSTVHINVYYNKC